MCVTKAGGVKERDSITRVHTEGDDGMTSHLDRPEVERQQSDDHEKHTVRSSH